MGADYYGTLLPVRKPGAGLQRVVAGLRLPYRVQGAVLVPGGQIVVAFVSDSALLSRMFADHWAAAPPGREPDATLYALAGPAASYRAGGHYDLARWWSPEEKTLVVFGFGSYRLAKVCIRGMCSAVSGDDTVFLHGCALSLSAGGERRGVVITGDSGAGKTTLVAGLLGRAGYGVTVLNDDWGAVSLSSGMSVSTGERKLHMKSSSVRALRPGLFASAPAGCFSYDLSDPDQTARVLITPESVYGSQWTRAAAPVGHVAVIVREPPGWLPPRELDKAIELLKGTDYTGYHRHHEPFFNGSLLLRTARDGLREERHFRRLLDRVRVSWINNCGPPAALVERFLAAVTREVDP